MENRGGPLKGIIHVLADLEEASSMDNHLKWLGVRGACGVEP